VTNAASTYRRLTLLALALLSLLAPSHVRASLSHGATLPFPDRAQHAAQHDLSAAQRDQNPTGNPNPTRRVRARDVGKAAAARRWVGASPEFVWDGEVLAFELDTETGPRAFVHEPGGFEPILQQQGGATYLCVNDHLGMPKELIDGAGTLAWAAAHSAYGAVIASESDDRTVESPFRLLGQVNDEDAELTWTRFRCFDAETGTWISTDPLGLLGGSKLYVYDGSPSVMVDPRGLSVQTGGPHHEVYTAADGTERIRFQADQAVTLQEATPGRNYSTDSLAGVTEDGKVYVHEGRHRAIGAAHGDTIPADVGGIPGRPGWLDYEYSRETAPAGGVPVRDLSIDNSQPDVSAAEADRVRQERWG
jgi:RHS repeat-associated protein